MNYPRDWDSLPQFFSVKELACFLGVGEAAAYALVKRKGFPCLKVGRKYRVSKDGLRVWIPRNWQ
ncbi:MAG: helix-turn-helix domain-containing protein [Desulfotomaculales bacterium]